MCGAGALAGVLPLRPGAGPHATNPATRSSQIVNSPAADQQTARALNPALLVSVISSSCAFADLLRSFISDPAIECAFKRVGFGRHQACCPKQGMRPGCAQGLGKVGFADTSENDCLTGHCIGLSGKASQLEVHEAIM